MKNNFGKIFIGAAIVAIGASVAYASYVSKQANEGVVITEHVKGNPTASVTLTEYSDFQCPACAQFYPVIKDLLVAHGDSLRFEYKHYPLITVHPYAVPAAKAAEAAAQQGKFFEMHNKLFENQPVWSNSGNPATFFATYAGEIGLDVGLFKRHMKASTIEDEINESFQEAQALGLRSTPSFFLNGQPMEFTTFDEFKTQIEIALGITSPVILKDGVEIPSAAPAAPAVEFGV